MNIVKVDRSLVEAAAVAAAAAKADAEQRHWQEEWLRRGLAELEQQREAAMARRRGSSSSPGPTSHRQQRGSEQHGFADHRTPSRQSPARSRQQSLSRSRSGSENASANGKFEQPGREPTSSEERQPTAVEEMPDASHEQPPSAAFPETCTHGSEGATAAQETPSATAPGEDTFNPNVGADLGTAEATRSESLSDKEGPCKADDTIQEVSAVPALPEQG